MKDPLDRIADALERLANKFAPVVVDLPINPPPPPPPPPGG